MSLQQPQLGAEYVRVHKRVVQKWLSLIFAWQNPVIRNYADNRGRMRVEITHAPQYRVNHAMKDGTQDAHLIGEETPLSPKMISSSRASAVGRQSCPIFE